MISEYNIRDGFKLVCVESDFEKGETYFKDVQSDFIQMHFCLGQGSSLSYGPHYSISLNDTKSIFLYNPNQELPINLSLQEGSKHLIFIISIKLFHSFFSQVAELIPFLSEDNRSKKYYVDKLLTPSEILVLNQIIDAQKNNGLHRLYIKAKAYEILSLYFGTSKEEKQSCPFLETESNVEKIKKAKQIIIENMSEPPLLQDLADEVGLSLQRLKDGFKHIYGESVFNFLLNYKMEYARKQLVSRKFNVSEISHQIGYSTASHFISAFKKKYGTTPKQYLLSLN